jgi:hypothetical protein
VCPSTTPWPFWTFAAAGARGWPASGVLEAEVKRSPSNRRLEPGQTTSADSPQPTRRPPRLAPSRPISSHQPLPSPRPNLRVLHIPPPSKPAMSSYEIGDKGPSARAIRSERQQARPTILQMG